MKTRISLPLWAIAVFPLHAQTLLDPMVVTASRTERAASDAPYSVDEMSLEDILENTRRTLPEALRFTPGVLVQKTTHGHGSPFIRGFTGRQNLLLIDGVRLNNSTWRSGPTQYWNTVDPFSLDHFELVKSQGSVLYGSDAIGGTLNAFTRSSDFREQEKDQLFSHGMAYYEYRSNGQGSHIGRIEGSLGMGNQYGLHLGISAKEYGDIEDSAIGRMRNTGYPEQDLDFRFDYALSQDTTLTLAHQQVNQDEVTRWHSTIFNPGWRHDGHVAAAGTWLARTCDQERSLSYLRIAQENADQSAWIRKWHATLSWQDTDDSEFQDRRASAVAPVTGTFYQQLQTAETRTLGFDSAFESPVGPGVLVYGVDYYRDEIDSAAFRNGVSRPASRPVADDASYDLFGAFAQYIWKASDRCELTAGTRYTHAATEWGAYRAPDTPADQSGEGSWDDFSSSLRMIYDLTDSWKIYGGVSQSFRAPNLSDLTGNAVTLSGLNAQGSPDLDPEQFITYEIGTRVVREKFNWDAAVFYTTSQGDGAIASKTDGPDTFAVNAEDSYLYGIETSVAWRIERDWSLSGFAAWQEGKTDVSDRPGPDERWITRQLPFTASLALRWTHSSQKYWIEGRVLGAAEAGRIHTIDQAADNQRIPTNGTPGYVVGMLHAGWKACDNLELNCGLENVTDVDYRDHGSGQNEPGFNAIVGAKLHW